LKSCAIDSLIVCCLCSEGDFCCLCSEGDGEYQVLFSDDMFSEFHAPKVYMEYIKTTTTLLRRAVCSGATAVRRMRFEAEIEF